MPFADHDDVVKAFPSNRTNDLCVSNVLVGYTLLWEVRHAPTGEPG